MSKTKKTPKLRIISVHRGGSWDFFPQYARVANRGHDEPGCRVGDLGVRLVEVLDERD